MQKKIEWLLKEKYLGKPNAQFKKDIARLKKGEPLDYVIGFTEFLGCKIDLSKKPLIPRFETEYWVELAMETIKKQQGNIKMLDVFSGSGCIGVAMLAHCKQVKVTFVDSQINCIEQIKISCKINNISKKRYTIIQSDIFKNVTDSYDYIFANPPYIPTTRKSKVQKSVVRYEPKKALFGGNDGLFYIRKFLAAVKNFLNPGGKIYMEFDPPQKNQIEILLKKYGYKDWEFRKDQYGKFRYVAVNDL
jgi:release factor glutamine methyltransferase